MTIVARYVNTVYCDDVRHEIDGKLSFMGVYTGASLLIPHQLPLVIPKICAVINAYTSIDEPFEKLIVSLYKDEEVLQTIECPAEELSKRHDPKNVRPDASTIFVGLMFVLQGFMVEGPCILSVRAITEREEFLSSKLRIEFANK